MKAFGMGGGFLKDMFELWRFSHSCSDCRGCGGLPADPPLLFRGDDSRSFEDGHAKVSHFRGVLSSQSGPSGMRTFVFSLLFASKLGCSVSMELCGTAGCDHVSLQIYAGAERSALLPSQSIARMAMLVFLHEYALGYRLGFKRRKWCPLQPFFRL